MALHAKLKLSGYAKSDGDAINGGISVETLEFEDRNDIAGMGHMAQRFLEVIKNRSDERVIGLEFQPRQNRRTKELFLEATIRFKSLMGDGNPMRIRVYSRTRGLDLHVGYTVITDEINDWQIAMWRGNALADSIRTSVTRRPDNQRKLADLMDAFVRAVYLPTIRDLESAAHAQRRGGN